MQPSHSPTAELYHPTLKLCTPSLLSLPLVTSLLHPVTPFAPGFTASTSSALPRGHLDTPGTCPARFHPWLGPPSFTTFACQNPRTTPLPTFGFVGLSFCQSSRGKKASPSGLYFFISWLLPVFIGHLRFLLGKAVYALTFRLGYLYFSYGYKGTLRISGYKVFVVLCVANIFSCLFIFFTEMMSATVFMIF